MFRNLFGKGLLVGAMCALSVFGQASIAGASIVSATMLDGSFQLITPPAAVGRDDQQVNRLMGFNEKQNIALVSDINTNVGLPKILAGTVVSSHYLLYDPRCPDTVKGYVNFDSKVLGIITSRSNLVNTYDFLGIDTTTYNHPALVGLEFGDWARITGENQIKLNFSAVSPGDYIRVITAGTAPVPEPASMALLGIGMAGMGLMRRRRMAA